MARSSSPAGAAICRLLEENDAGICTRKEKEEEEEEEEGEEENGEEIDALVNLDEGEDEDLASTADSFCATQFSRRARSEEDEEEKRAKLRGTLNTLRRMVGGECWMDAAAVFEEAIRHVKALQLKVANLGLDGVVYAATALSEDSSSAISALSTRL